MFDKFTNRAKQVIKLAKKEENLMEKEFGESYKRYKSRTAAFIPKLSDIAVFITSKNLVKNK